MTSSAPSTEAPVSLDVTLRWKDDVLAVRHLAIAGSAAVGDVPGSLGRIPAPGFVFARLARGRGTASIPAGSTATVIRADGGHEIVEGPAEPRLHRGDALTLPLEGFTLRAAAVAPEHLALPAAGRRFGAALPIALAAAAHLAVLGLAAQAAMAHTADEVEEERPAALRELLVSAENDARARDRVADVGPGGTGEGQKLHERAGDGRPGGGERSAGARGAMGNPDAHDGKHGRYALPEQSKRDHEPAVSREAALQDAAEFGMIGVLAQGANVPVPAPWKGEIEARGADPIAAWGEMWGPTMGGAYAPGGLELSGVGFGGGGVGLGTIGLGTIGTIGHGSGKPGDGTGGNGGVTRGFGGGWGSDWGHLIHRVKKPSWRSVWGGRWEYTTVSGRLPPQSIQRIIRQNFGRFRLCYENGLRKNPQLAGRVTVRFVIGRDGAVSNVGDGGSTMPDPEVVSCVVRAFYGLSFPQPEGGIVTVSYPIIFSPVE